MNSDTRRVRIRISGQVQGVYFRAYAQEEAQRLGLCGWVRNMPDGSVEALVEGKSSNIERMINWCYKGSPLSTVTTVKVAEEDPNGEFSGFSIRYY